MVARRTKPPTRTQGNPRRSMVYNLLMGALNELEVSRRTLAAMRDGSLDPTGRDLDKECGYPDVVTVATFRQLYARWGICRRVVNVYPDECWAVPPEIYEDEDPTVDTRFEKAWRELNQRINLAHYWHRADRLMGLGRFGVLLMGLSNTGGDLSLPVPGVNPKTGEKTANRPKKDIKLLYLRPFAEDQVQVRAVEQDASSPRFGQPVSYNVTFADPNAQGGELTSTTTRAVHWTRVIHLADNLESSDVAGVARLEPVLNYCLDLRKIGGSSAEMWYKGGFPGFSFETIPDLIGESVMDEESVKEQFEEYMEGLKRYLALDGVTAKPLYPQIADPTPHAMLQLNLIAATIGVPLRTLLGSEMGHLAATQDAGNWNRRIAHRQGTLIDPRVIRATIDRLILVGVLPEPASGTYKIEWRDLNTVTDKDKAMVTLQRAQALMQYVSGGCEAVMPVHEFLTLVMGFTVDEANEVTAKVEEAKKANKFLTDPFKMERATQQSALDIKAAKAKPKPQGGGRTGNPPRRPAGRPAGGGPGTAA